MNLTDFLPHLACPACCASLDWECTGAPMQDGWLMCRTCLSRTPVMGGIAFFTQTEMDVGERHDPGLQRERLAGSDDEWSDYLGERRRRQSLEPYAAFAPFNEAHRAALPLLEALQDRWPAGSLILDLSNRTGWSGELLAGMFPQSLVMAVWEGDTSVLGYRGFLRLMDPSHRSGNLLLAFSSPHRRPPVRQHAAILVHAHDCLHRHPQPQFLNDCLAIVHPEGTIIAPHVHLSNSEPSPFFHRGGVLRHGTHYRAWLQARLRDDSRVPCVWSEADLFKMAPPSVVADGADTTHYNGLVSVSRPDLFQRGTGRDATGVKISRACRCIANPLLRVNPLLRRCFIDDEALGRQTTHLLERHPVYRERLDPLAELRLDIEDLRAVALCEHGHTAAEMTEILQLSWEELRSRLHRLAQYELLMPAPVTAQMVHAQHFHAGGHGLIDCQVLRSWKEWVDADPLQPFGSVLSTPINRREADEVLTVIVRFVSAQELSQVPGIRSTPAPSALTALVCLAFVACGVRVVDETHEAALNINETSGGDVVISSASKPDVWLSSVLEAFGEGTAPAPSAAEVDPKWWQPIAAVLGDAR
jgi:hypothetical protein